MNQWCVYILRCSDDQQSLYCGITNNLEKRLKTHNAGRGAKFTKGRRPVSVIGIFKCDDRSSASKLEYKIKQLTRTQKLELCNEKNDV